MYILAAPFQGVWGKTCESSVTKLIVKLKIALAVLGIISMSVDIVVNLKGILTLKTTFARFFLLKSLFYQRLFVSLQRQSSPSLLTMLKSCEAFFIYTHLNMANLVPFTKRFESSENLVNLLESRGLQIYDRNKAIQYLDNIGYYRLSAYMYPLLKMPKTAHLYKEGSSFKKVMMLYRFDKKLRLLMFNEIEKIEIAIPK